MQIFEASKCRYIRQPSRDFLSRIETIFDDIVSQLEILTQLVALQ